MGFHVHVGLADTGSAGNADLVCVIQDFMKTTKIAKDLLLPNLVN